MKNWLVPATVLGLSGLALLFASERGRAQMRAVFSGLGRVGDPLGEFDRLLEGQLSAIQRTLDELAEAMGEQSA
jgi:hypothetical protein